VLHYHGHVCALVVFFEVGGGEGGVALEEEEEGVFGHGGMVEKVEVEENGLMCAGLLALCCVREVRCRRIFMHGVRVRGLHAVGSTEWRVRTCFDNVRPDAV
jgi:hypothetical protein